jgi:3'-phosphoadenosine 5'-phosphosulfate sulfotransferase (PAPS reductase)/FAD synthetase
MSFVAHDMLAPHWRHDEPIEEARRLIRLAVQLYGPREVWALCSGGNDSLCSTHIAMSTGLVTGVASINTTIGIEETREHLRTVARRFSWNLKWFYPPVSYRDLCARFGMPGPGGHPLIYQRLKYRPLLQLTREAKRQKKDRVMLITGCRLSESSRRMGHVKPIQRDGSRVWVAPIINWDAETKAVYQINNAIPFNPVTAKLGISGECLCGAFAKPGERAKIAEYYPKAMAEIEACESAAACNGMPAKWGKRPSRRSQHLCQQCERKNEDSE